MTRFFSPLRPLLKGWLVSFLVFGLLATVLVGQFARLASMTLPEALRMAARDWLLWALAAPLVFRLVSRFPLERGRWKGALPVHLLSAAACLALAYWWADALRPSFGPGGPRGGSLRMENRAARTPASPTEGQRPPLRGGASGRNRTGFHLFFLLSIQLPIYLGIVSIAHAVLFYRRSQSRERRSLELEASLARARLDALKAQLQPHFLFNSLNAISELVHKDAETADAMLGALSDFLRLTLESSGEQEVPLRRELEFVERYLSIEKVRFGERLRFAVDAAPDALPALVPALVLQPLVENAVRHGLEPRIDGGTLAISAEREGDRLRLRVADNGAGLRSASPPREGIGLANTRARLRELYGDAARLDIQNGDGVSVSITLPFHTAAAA